MDKNYYIRLTLAVYRVTELFPENEPLRLKIREKANDLLAELIGGTKENPVIGNKELIEKDIEVINGFFDLAQEQDWVDPRNFLILKQEYNKIREKWGQSPNNWGMPLIKNQEREALLNERQRKILKIMEKKDRVQIWEVKEFFPDVTKRTLRRDFEDLLNKKLVKRIGKKNETFYQLIG